jgi:hypothetical protein
VTVLDDFINDFMGSSKQPPWGRIAASFLGGAQMATSKVSDQVLQWGALLVRNAAPRWAPLAVKNMFCAFDECRAQALVPCAACGNAFCLAHSMLSHHAEGICEGCALELVQSKRGVRDARQQRQQASAAAPKKDETAAAFRALRLPKTASWDEIKSAYKKLCVKHNADKPQSGASRAKNTERLKEINAAYAVLRNAHEKAAA